MSESLAGLLFITTLAVALAVVHRPLGDLLYWIATSPRDLAPERAAYRLVGADPKSEQSWSAYARSVLAFSAVSVLFLYGLLRLQSHLPLSLGFSGVAPDQAWNTAVSFVTNTNWQSYSGESTMGHLAQMSGLAVQNFVSAAVGIAVVFALIRGFARTASNSLGNFWVDLTRICVRLLLPVAVIFAIIFIAAGMVQNLSPGTDITTLAGNSQHLTGGPVASQEVIKELGTNGGGFYNSNSAHPFENPTASGHTLQPAASVRPDGR
jgi:potassium-transporting ATPase potassium-binding subunit